MFQVHTERGPLLQGDAAGTPIAFHYRHNAEAFVARQVASGLRYHGELEILAAPATGGDTELSAVQSLIYRSMGAAPPAPEEAEECEGHEAGPDDPMGVTTFCDGSCRPAMSDADVEASGIPWDAELLLLTKEESRLIQDQLHYDRELHRLDEELNA